MPVSSKIFVLDTSVILYDHRALHSFEENDVAIPLTVLEELDRFKKGHSVLNLNAREFLRGLDSLSDSNLLKEWIPLNGAGSGRVRVVAPNGSAQELGFLSSENDHRILGVALDLGKEHRKRRVVLVTKDINLRIKARSLGLVAEDYKRSQVADVDRLRSGRTLVEVERPELVDALHATGQIARSEVLDEVPPANQFVTLRSDRGSALGIYDAEDDVVRRIQKGSAYGVKTRNAEQTFALHAILDPRIRLATLTGPAGTGKTLLALAGALEQRREFRQVYLTRPLIPLSNRDMGFLPGDVESKIDPYMQPLWDNLSFIRSQLEPGSAEARQLEGMIEQKKIEIIPLAYIRGRTFAEVLLIVDEAQNLTPHEVKTIITRAGEGTKIIFTGDIFQIDTPYLDAQSNGLSFLVDRMKGQEMVAHVTLKKGERSALADLASRLL